MLQHHTAFFEKNNERKSEDHWGEPWGLAPLCSFLEDYYPFFHVRTRPSFVNRAQQYVSGLFQLETRRNMERIDSTANGSDYQSLQHFLTHSKWDDEAVCAKISQDTNRLLGGSPDSCLIIDPSGIPKKGRHSVGVERQYCGNTGKIDNCQVAVFAALAKGRDACLINKRLYLPKAWCSDPERCDKAGIPSDKRDYKCRGQLALELIDDADRDDLDYSWIGADAEFGKPWLLRELMRRDKKFLIDVPSNFYVHTTNPRLSYRHKVNKLKKIRLKKKSVKVEDLRLKHGRRKWRTIEIRDSSKGVMTAEFLHKKVWFSDQTSEPPRLVHLIIRRTPKDGGKGYLYKYSLGNAPAQTSTQRLAYQQSQRFWVEQAIRDAKDGLGLDEYQIRKWNGWQHHVALTLLAGLYVLKTRLEHREDLPLLSIQDVRDILAFLLPRKVQTFQDVIRLIDHRHDLRRQSYENCRNRELEGVPPSGKVGKG